MSSEGKERTDGDFGRCINLSGGNFAFVDAGDYDELAAYPWRCDRGRARRTEKGRTIYMHRQIMGFPEKCWDVDHINGDPLDNRRRNLRLATRTQNQLNNHKRRKTVSGFKGVHWKIEPTRVTGGSWCALLRVSGRRYEQPGFATPEEAARQYDAFAVEHGQGFATLNFPDAAMSAQEKSGE